MKKKIRHTDEIEKLFQAKRLFHKEMAELPFEEKIEMLIKLQELANDIKSISGKRRGRIWKVR